MSNNFAISEYLEIGNNMRHLNDLRSSTVNYMLTAFGVLMLALSTVMTSEKLPPEKQLLIAGILSLLGVFISIASFAVEKRSVRHFNLLKERAVEIEKENGVTGQMTLVNNNLGHRNSGSATTAVRTLHFFLMIFWVAVFFALWKL